MATEKELAALGVIEHCQHRFHGLAVAVKMAQSQPGYILDLDALVKMLDESNQMTCDWLTAHTTYGIDPHSGNHRHFLKS